MPPASAWRYGQVAKPGQGWRLQPTRKARLRATTSSSPLKRKTARGTTYLGVDTPGCTTAACGFRDDHADLLAAGAAVLGVSPDPVKSHAKFRLKFSLPFALLGDPDHRVAELYGAWGQKKMYGKVYDGILRTTYIVDEKGIITHVFPNVKVQEHSKEVLAALRGSS